jgi:hypothetical protein
LYLAAPSPVTPSLSTLSSLPVAIVILVAIIVNFVTGCAIAIAIGGIRLNYNGFKAKSLFSVVLAINVLQKYPAHHWG